MGQISVSQPLSSIELLFFNQLLIFFSQFIFVLIDQNLNSCLELVFRYCLLFEVVVTKFQLGLQLFVLGNKGIELVQFLILLLLVLDDAYTIFFLGIKELLNL